MNLAHESKLFVRQKREMAEFFGFETRNKYEILRPDGQLVGFAAEQGKGIIGQIMRQFLGHWRTFEIHFFGPDRKPVFKAVHPFRWIFQRLDIYDLNGQKVGAIQQRFGILHKSFDVEGAQGQVLFTVRSALWKIWTFPFLRQGREIGAVSKKWSGVFSEMFTDRDNFMVDFGEPGLQPSDKALMLSAAVFIDLIYFEKKANS